MLPVSQSLSHGRLTLEYFSFGNGEKTIICLHGHGRHASDFEFVAGNGKRVISINLFHHGNSTFPVDDIEENPLRTSELIELFQLLLDTEKVVRFHLFAFSQGGRFSLCLLPYFAEQLETITLIAPDGMDNKSFYNWSSRKKWARRIFRNFEKDPSRFKWFTKIAFFVKLIRPKVKSFVDEFSSDQERFKRASETWRNFRMLQPDINQIKKALNEYPIYLQIIMGTYDQIIRPKQAYKFAQKIGRPHCVKEIPNGHNFFKPGSRNKFLHFLPFG
jgi:pimeloyl-ACP methyl ester carboxylesterase